MPTLARSFLFVPGNRPDRFAKALASGVHTIVVDLEDSVAPDAKIAARAAVAAWLSQGHQALVRINASDTPWFEGDLEMLQAFAHVGVMLSKAGLQSLRHVGETLPSNPIIALLETVEGFMELSPMSKEPRLSRFAFGSVDFGIDSGMADSGDAMTMVRSHIVLHSRAAGLPAPIDGVSVNFSDHVQMQADAQRARQLGFGGKLCIHPAQVPVVNAAFTPSTQDQDWAARVLHAFDASGGSATAVDGKMIDRPVVELARRILAEVSTSAIV